MFVGRFIYYVVSFMLRFFICCDVATSFIYWVGFFTLISNVFGFVYPCTEHVRDRIINICIDVRRLWGGVQPVVREIFLTHRCLFGSIQRNHGFPPVFFTGKVFNITIASSFFMLPSIIIKTVGILRIP